MLKATHLLIGALIISSAACSREDRQPAVETTIAGMGTPESDADHAAVELVRVALTMEAYRAEGMDDPEAHDEWASLETHAATLLELTGVSAATTPDSVQTSLAASSSFDADGEHVGDRGVFFRSLHNAEMACDRAWQHYYY